MTSPGHAVPENSVSREVADRNCLISTEPEPSRRSTSGWVLGAPKYLLNSRCGPVALADANSPECTPKLSAFAQSWDCRSHAGVVNSGAAILGLQHYQGQAAQSWDCRAAIPIPGFCNPRKRGVRGAGHLATQPRPTPQVPCTGGGAHHRPSCSHSVLCRFLPSPLFPFCVFFDPPGASGA